MMVLLHCCARVTAGPRAPQATLALKPLEAALHLPHIAAMEHLEEKLAHLQRVVDDLSDVVARQDRELITLRDKVERLVLREAERESDGTGGVVLGDERPPHY